MEKLKCNLYLKITLIINLNLISTKKINTCFLLYICLFLGLLDVSYDYVKVKKNCICNDFKQV